MKKNIRYNPSINIIEGGFYKKIRAIINKPLKIKGLSASFKHISSVLLPIYYVWRNYQFDTVITVECPLITTNFMSDY